MDRVKSSRALGSPQRIFHRQDWMIGVDHQTWLQRVQQRQLELQDWIECQKYPKERYPRILLVHTDPLEFLAGLMAACLGDCPVFLGNPHWQRFEWQQVLPLVNPHIIWDASQLPQIDMPELAPARPEERGWILIPTGGSSGKIRFAIHTWSTLAAAVEGCQRHFFGSQRGAIHSCCWLPLYHVSGLMQFMRSLLTEGQFVLLPKHCFSANPPLEPAVAAFLDPKSEQPCPYFLSLVPTQLQRLLQQSEVRLQWLARFRTILVGGAPTWPSLLQGARQHDLRLALTYGMTETAAQIATLDPDHFLQGAAHNGKVLPHAQITIQDEQQQPRAIYQTGQVVVQSQSLCQGYYPQPFAAGEPFVTDDLGYFNDQGDLRIVGRLSRKIISGGENVFPEEIEAVLLGTGMVKDAVVIGQPDLDWGQSITAVVVPLDTPFSIESVKRVLETQLSKVKQPKRWVVLPTLPRTPQGKIAPSQLKIAVQSNDWED